MESSNRRLLSLDAFRGFTIALMILVNSLNPFGRVYPQLRHAAWNGWTFADTVFPFFLFIMGVSMTFSFARRKENNPSNSLLWLKIVRRTAILFGLGLFLNSYPGFQLSTLRIPGVLQRIALCYFFAALIVKDFGPKGQFYWLCSLLAVYWPMMHFVPVPGIGAGAMEPGRNFAAYVDSLFLEGHMYYETWDPEGLVSTIPAMGTTLFGVLTGNWLRLPNISNKKKTVAMISSGVALLILGMVLDYWLPINKNIWTSSFSIFMAGLSLLLLAFFYWLMEIEGYRRWAKGFVIFGLNSIAIYFLSIILDPLVRFVLNNAAQWNPGLGHHLMTSCWAPLASPENVSLIYGISYVFLMFLIAWTMWKMKLFINV